MTQRTRDPFFYRTGLAMLAALLLAFPLTYFQPLLAGDHFRPLRHVHGAAFFAWFGLYVWQARLVTKGRTPRHRETGLFGLLLTGTMLVLGPWMALGKAEERLAAGTPAPLEFTLYNVTDMALFGGFMFAAVACIARRIEWHRRFIYAAALCLLGPALSRWFVLLPDVFPWAYFGPNLLADLLLVALALHDRKAAGRIHPATLVASAIMLTDHLAVPYLARTDAWDAAGRWLVTLG